MINKLAVVESSFSESDVEIMEYAIVRKNVHIGKNVIIHPFAIIEEGVVIGDNVEVFPYAYILFGYRVVPYLIYYVAGLKLFPNTSPILIPPAAVPDGSPSGFPYFLSHSSRAARTSLWLALVLSNSPLLRFFLFLRP